MNVYYRFLVLFAAAYFAASPVAAQWQAPNHSVPIGRGLGIVGFGNAPPAGAGLPLISNGATADPSFQVLPNAGLAPMAANRLKGAAAAGAPADLPLPSTTCAGLGWVAGTGFSCPGAGSSVYTQIVTFGAVCDANLLSANASFSITAGSNVLTGTGGNVGFGPGDVGKSIWVPGAGPTGGGLSTTIAGFTSTTVVTLASNASTTISALPASQLNPLVYGTDDTAAINTAIVATPPFGTLYINPVLTSGCLIKQSGASGRSLLVDHPINILGGGNGSVLLTDPSMGATVIGIHATVSSVTWVGITWQGFTLGTNTNFVPFTRYGAHGIWFDATSAGPGGFAGINIGPNISIGESAGGFYSLILDGVASQGNRIVNNRIAGGIFLNATADSNMILQNRLQGVGPFGVRVDTPGAGNFILAQNSVTLAAGVCILSGSGIVVAGNFFEEETASTQYPRNNFLDIGCGSGAAINSVWVYGNILLTGLSTTSLAVRIDAPVVSTFLFANEIANSTGRTSVQNLNATTVCGPNQWLTSATHVSGTAPINWGPAC